MVSKLDFPLRGSSLNIVKQCQPALGDIIQSKFGCVVTIDGVEFEGQQKRTTIVPEKRFEVTLHTGVRVSVWKGDLTCFPVDAVVNAANSSLKHHGGLALALSMAGGPQIQMESDDYINRNGILRTGSAIVTDAGLLPYKKIIHAVGPFLSRYAPKADVQDAELLLKQTIRSILDKVRETHLQSVAIPAISSGLFNFPLPLCADTIVANVKYYYENSPHHGFHPQEIFLVNNDEPSVREMERACHHKLMSYSQAAASKSQGAARVSTPTVKIGNVHLTLRKGNIEQQQVIIICNVSSICSELIILIILYNLNLSVIYFPVKLCVNRCSTVSYFLVFFMFSGCLDISYIAVLIPFIHHPFCVLSDRCHRQHCISRAKLEHGSNLESFIGESWLCNAKGDKHGSSTWKCHHHSTLQAAM